MIISPIYFTWNAPVERNALSWDDISNETVDIKPRVFLPAHYTESLQICTDQPAPVCLMQMCWHEICVRPSATTTPWLRGQMIHVIQKKIHIALKPMHHFVWEKWWSRQPRAFSSIVNTWRPRQNGRHFPDDIFNQWLLVYWRIYASLSFNELKWNIHTKSRTVAPITDSLS